MRPHRPRDVCGPDRRRLGGGLPGHKKAHPGHQRQLDDCGDPLPDARRYREGPDRAKLEAGAGRRA
jgi:hypothetical protein